MRKRKPRKTAGINYEIELAGQQFQAVVGMDEAGRGAWAGPVSAGAVILPSPPANLMEKLEGVRDSKQMTPRQRGILTETIKSVAVAWGIGHATNDEIDKFGIVPATHLAMKRALEQLQRSFPAITPDCLLLDSMRWADAPLNCTQINIPKGDQNSLSIAAASVLAKTWRDALMCDVSEELPHYGFANHKGYGTRWHYKALHEYGVSSFHRRTFAPVRAVLNQR